MASQERMQAKVGEDVRRLEGGVPFLVTTIGSFKVALISCLLGHLFHHLFDKEDKKESDK
jgi:hypothetical protein